MFDVWGLKTGTRGNQDASSRTDMEVTSRQENGVLASQGCRYTCVPGGTGCLGLRGRPSAGVPVDMPPRVPGARVRAAPCSPLPSHLQIGRPRGHCPQPAAVPVTTWVHLATVPCWVNHQILHLSHGLRHMRNSYLPTRNTSCEVFTAQACEAIVVIWLVHEQFIFR